MKGIFNKLKSGLAKTRVGLVQGISRVIGGHKVLTDDLIDEIEEILLLSDVGVQVAEHLVGQLKQLVQKNGAQDSDTVLAMLKQEMINLLTGDSGLQKINTEKVKPFVVSVVGVNGTGKTTTIGKLAYSLKQEGKSVLVAAADTFRAAAMEQLEIWSKRAGAVMVRNKPGADPAAVAFDALQAAKARAIDVLIVDTAGRLHTKTNLMEELKKIHRVLDKAMPGAPHEVFLVIDATTGQNGLSQAKLFTEAVNVTGLVLTKLDGTARGGVIFAIRQNLKIPVHYVGLGEKIDDLQTFNPSEFVEALFA